MRHLSPNGPLLSPRLEGTEDKFRNRESRPEDLQVIAELKDMVTERESLVKKLVVSVCTQYKMAYRMPFCGFTQQS